jgi:hypothetical protein
LWAVAIAINHSRVQERTVTPFVVVECLAALCFPLFFVAGFLLMANVIDFITSEAADARKALPRFLNAVKFEKGGEKDHWIIEDSLYFTLKKRERKRFSCYPNFATWVLVSIVCLAFIFSVSYFVDIVLDMQVSVTSCDDPRIDRTFSCFNSSTLEHVDCVTDTAVNGILHCFKFYRFGVDVDLIQSIATAYAVYLVASAIFGHIFLVMKVLLHLTKKVYWGGLLVAVGVLFFFGSIVVIVIWLNGYISPIASELSRLNVINLAQFVMVSWFILLTGLLMIGGEWAEKDTKPKQS